MAFDISKLRKTCDRTWHYEDTAAVNTIVASGYFSTAYLQFQQFDVINIVSATGGTAAMDTVLVSSATGATTVTTAALA
tara:strand:- start:4187 stop:4423 length:237 start_codon:yes stop_codon:yes gene_type:complete